MAETPGLPLRYNPDITDPSVGSITGAASTIATTDLTPSRLVGSNGAGKIVVLTATFAEGNFLSGVTSAIQTQLDSKEPTVTKGDLTESTSSILTITGGTGAVIGSGLTIQVTAASTGVSGYLTGTDWNTFNSKLGSALTDSYLFVGNGSNVATGVPVTGDVSITNAGVVAITSDSIVNADINSVAAISLSKLAAVSVSRALVSDGSGFVTAATTTATEIGYVNGVTSAIQTQLNSKLTVSLTGLATGDVVYYNGANWINLGVGSDGEVLKLASGVPTWASETAPSGVPAGGTAAQYVEKIDGTDYNTQWVTLTASKITDVTSSATELNLLTGVTTSSTQLNYLNTATSDVQVQIDAKQEQITGGASSITSADLIATRALVSDGTGKVAVSSVTSTQLGYLTSVSSDIQTQLNAKQSTTLTNNAILYGSGGVATELAAGTEGYVLTISSGTPAWVAASGGDVTKVGTPLNNQIGVWTGDGTLEGEADLTFDGTSFNINANNINVSRSATGEALLTLGTLTAGHYGGLLVTGNSTADLKAIIRNTNTVGGSEAYLEVETNNADNYIRLWDANSNKGFAMGMDNGDDYLKIVYNTTTRATPSVGTELLAFSSVGVGIFGTTPVAQQTTTSQTPASFTANTSGISDDTATWGGYTVGDLVAILQAFGWIA